VEVGAGDPDCNIAGDYNRDGTVNAADDTVWRDYLGQMYHLPNESSDATPGSVTSEDYDVWRAHFGESCDGIEAGQPVTSATDTVTWSRFSEMHDPSALRLPTSVAETNRSGEDRLIAGVPYERAHQSRSRQPTSVARRANHAHTRSGTSWSLKLALNDWLKMTSTEREPDAPGSELLPSESERSSPPEATAFAVDELYGRDRPPHRKPSSFRMVNRAEPTLAAMGSPHHCA